MTEKRIIMPGDPGWDKPRAEEVAPTLKVPGEALEQVFRDVVGEVKQTIETKPEEGQVPVQIVSPEELKKIRAKQAEGKPAPSYKFHHPSRQKSFRIPVPKPITAELLEDLPRSWETKCLVGGIDYVTVEGQPFKQRVRRPGFKKGEHVTLTEMVFFPGVGALYGFAEGNRGGFGVRPDQVSFSMPMVESPESVVSATPVQDIQSPKLEEQHNGDPSTDRRQTD
jgi:hypothetical protein